MDSTSRGKSMEGSPSVDVVTPKYSRRASLDFHRGRKPQIEEKRERRHSESDIMRRTSTSEKGKLMYKDGLYKTCESSLVPKFGDWDATDPSSGIGFTAVFERVMDEKKRGGCAYVAPTPSTFRSASSQKKRYSFWCYPRKSKCMVDT